VPDPLGRLRESDAYVERWLQHVELDSVVLDRRTRAAEVREQQVLKQRRQVLGRRGKYEATPDKHPAKGEFRHPGKRPRGAWPPIIGEQERSLRTKQTELAHEADKDGNGQTDIARCGLRSTRNRFTQSSKKERIWSGHHERGHGGVSGRGTHRQAADTRAQVSLQGGSAGAR
jgi:hypothetical protein